MKNVLQHVIPQEQLLIQVISNQLSIYIASLVTEQIAHHEEYH